MRVVIVEDEIRIREGIIKLLSKTNDEFCLVGEAENGKDGLQLLCELKPDIVITDIKMPLMDGLQMLDKMQEAGLNTKAIVLSAYSEFEYARKAMKLGVTEYLLKPITYHCFMLALENVKHQVEKDRQDKPAQIGTIEQIFQFLLDGSLEINEELISYLSNNYHIEKNQSFVVMCTYLGCNYQEIWEKTKTRFNHALSMYKNLSYCIIEAPYRNFLIIILYHYSNSRDLERWMQYQILNKQFDKFAIGWIEVNGIGALEQSVKLLYPYMDWNIALDKEILISYPKITQIQTASCVYPIELETEVKKAVCAYDWDKVSQIMIDFQRSFLDGKIYIPKEIKECYVRFLWVVVGIAKEVGCIDTEKFDSKKLLEMIMNAQTKEELWNASNFMISLIRPERKQEETIHLIVKKVISIIHEFYKTGITLEEISMRLNMTPEYIGTLFHKEMGVTFSAYIKNIRISKAKELLCGTDLKLYEISERVGYNDPKYFSKVFKEITGQLPTDYRKTYK